MNIIILPMYNLGMSIVIAQVTKDGILFSADKRITNAKDESYEDNCMKAFPVGDRVVVGVVGKNVNDPKIYQKVLNRRSKDLAHQTVRDCTVWIAESISDLHDLENDPPEIKLVVSGYNDSNPAIYEIRVTGEVGMPIDRTSGISTDDEISYDLTEGSLKIIQKREYAQTSYEKTLKEHRNIIRENSEKNVSISRSCDSYLIKPDSISLL